MPVSQPSNRRAGRPQAPRTAPVPGQASGPEDAGGRGAGNGTYHVTALTRGLLVLHELAQAGVPLGLAQLQDRTSLPKSTLVRLLSVLTDTGYVLRVDEAPTFWLGPAVMPLAESYASALDVSACAQGVLETLAAATGQTANVAILDGTDVVHLCVVEPNRPIRFRSATGSRDGAHQTGLGKVLLAFAPTDVLSQHLPPDPYEARTKRTITTRRALLAELERIRRAGYAFDDEEGDLGVRCLAVPIYRHPDVVAAISVTGPAGELAVNAHARLLANLREAAVTLEKQSQFQHALQIARRSVA
jgi:IclR family acetate operon transcriptional repressor